MLHSFRNEYLYTSRRVTVQTAAGRENERYSYAWKEAWLITMRQQ
jgi:hypothetical protein